MEISNELVRRGHYVEVWARRGAKLTEQLQEGVVVRYLPFLNDCDLYSIACFRNACSNFDIVHTHLGRACTLSGIASALSSSSKRKKYIAHMHSYHKPGHYRGHRNIICVSRDVEQYVNTNFHWTPVTQVIYNGISFSKHEIENSRSFLNMDSVNPHEVKIGLLATFKWEKGHLHLLYSFHDLLHICPNVKLYLAGEGPLRHDAEKHAMDLGILKKVVFTGFVEPENVFQFWKRMDIACFPSLSEGLPLAAIESMLSGCPVVYYGNTGLEELVADSGVKIEWGNRQALTRALNQLVSSPELRKEISLKSRKRSLDFTAEHMVDQILNLYYGIAKK